MEHPRKEKLEQLSSYERKSYLSKHIQFNWFIDQHSLLEAILSLGLHHYRYDYLVDDDFERYVFRDVTSDQAVFIAERLIKDSLERASEFQKKWNTSVSWPGCSKGRFILSELNKDGDGFWKENPKNLLGYARRINCGCHESGSFAKRDE